MLLTAGLGTRLRPLSLVRAKAAVPVNGRPIVGRVIGWLVSQAITDVVLNLHHRPSSIAAVVGDGSDLGARVRYSWENPVLGSAGGPRHALPLLTDGSRDADVEFLIVNGDTLTDLPLAEMIDAHHASGARVTMALTRNPRPDLYGGVLVDRGRITGFARRGAAPESFHFIGIQVARASVFSPLQDGVASETVMQLYPELIRQHPNALAAHVVEAPFRDVGTPADYLQTSLALAAVEGDRLVSASGTAIDRSALVQRTAVWDDVTIGEDARLEDCIICDGVRVPAGARYSRCALVPYRGEALQEREHVAGDVLVRPF